MTSIDLDMAQFHEIFFEESSEGIESMEKGLLNLNSGTTPDPELVNTVFRAAHSIKGAASTFGFNDIADFTHTIESILDEVRDRKREVTQDLVDALLKSADYLKYLIECSKNGESADLSAKEELTRTLNSIPRELDTSSVPRWRIRFKPHDYMLKTGNDPFRIIRELKHLGNLEIRVDTSGLPALKELNPEISCLSWELFADARIKKQDILDVFEWVLDDCELDIALLGERRKLVERRKPRGPADETAAAAGESASIRVHINKIDSLINLVGEMVITQSMLNRYASDTHIASMERLRDVVKVFESNTRELQEQAMRIRMLPIDYTFQRLPRTVHDISRSLNKKVELKISGNTTEVDKTVLEKIADPLTHLIRNAIDHGIEPTKDRIAADKPETGTISIKAFQEGGKIVIQLSDDGAGLNLGKILHKAREKRIVRDSDELTESQIQNLIFQPGFSTASEVTDLSGRGVGMDVVKRNINDLGGSVEVESTEGKGCVFTIRLPLTLAIIDGQLIKNGQQIMVIPMLNIIESVQPEKNCINIVTGKKEVYHYRGDYIPIIRLHRTFGIKGHEPEILDSILVLVDAGHQRVGLLVDEVLGQQQVVIKSLETNFQLIKGISGATVLGDGTVAMIIDVTGLIELQGITTIQ